LLDKWLNFRFGTTIFQVQTYMNDMRCFIFSLLILVVISCAKTKPQGTSNFRNTDTTSSNSGTDTAWSYLALGDSYTIGQSVGETERFPAQIVAILRQQGIKISNPVYIAQTGWTTGNLQQAINNQNPSSFNVVTLLIGVNDQYQRVDTSSYAIRFAQLLEKAISLANGKKSNVFVLSIPDYSATPFVASPDKIRVSTEIDLFNAINKRVTLFYGVSYTDITPSTRQAATNATLIASDNLHPSGSEYRKWAEFLAPKIKAVL
jgi:lysophospholipase L1-like esterase